MAAPNIAVGNIVEWTIIGECCGQSIQNKFHYKIDTISGGAVGQPEFTAAFVTRMTGPTRIAGLIRLFMPTNWSGIRNRVQIVSPVRYIGLEVLWGVTGGNLIATNVSNVAACVTKRGNFGARTNISTSHFMLTDDSTFVANGKLTALTTTAMSALGSEIIDTPTIDVGGTDVSISPCIWVRSNPLQSIEITNFVVQETSRVMRRRTVGIGK